MMDILDGEGSNDWTEFEEMNEAGMDANAGTASEDNASDHPCFGAHQEAPEIAGSPMDTGEDMGETDGDGELQKRDGWPIWLKDTVDMLHDGEQGGQLTSVLLNFTKLERALGFKGEKTVFIISIGKERLLTMIFTG
jgi:hypothetical protein